MGTFDRLIADLPCPYCGALEAWRVQFKYGDVWLRDHKVGDMVPRSSTARRYPPRPKPIPGRIRISGVAEHPCMKCGAEGPYVAITVDDDQMTAMELLTYMPDEDEDSVIPE